MGVPDILPALSNLHSQIFFFFAEFYAGFGAKKHSGVSRIDIVVLHGG